MNLKTAIIGAAFALGLGTAEANAAVTYIYTGQPFTTFYQPNYTQLPSNLVVKVELLEALPPNLFMTPNKYVSGNFTISQMGEDLNRDYFVGLATFKFSTDSYGTIVGWSYEFESNIYLTSSSDHGDLLSIGRSFAYNEVPGSWSQVAAIPEPATWAMMITGFFGAGAMIRRRRPAPQPATA